MGKALGSISSFKKLTGKGSDCMAMDMAMGLVLFGQTLYHLSHSPPRLDCSFFLSFLTVLGFKLRASHLLGRYSATCPTPPAPVVLKLGLT
jgi:hypothetical protein